MMAEIFKREAANAPIDFSGERLTSAISGQIAVEHYHRYFLARDFCANLDVLDIAAGEGYGSAILAQVARSVVGVEIDATVVEAAKAEFNRPNLRYIQGDARAIPLPDASIDVAVSFETFEHFAEHEDFLAELRRVLRPNGLVIISTPDRDIYSGPGIPPNPFHVKEVNRPEFESALRAYFGNVRIARQRALIGSFVEGDQESVSTRHFEARDGDQIEAGETMERAPYLIGLASDAALPPLPRSLYVYRNDIDMDLRARQAAQADLQAARADLQAAQADLQHVEQQHVATMERATELHRTTKELEMRLAAAIVASDSMRQELERLRASLSWRASAPLRHVMTRYPGFGRRLRQVAKLVYWTATGQLPQRLADRRQALASKTAREVPKSRASLEDLKKQAVDTATSDLIDFLNSGARISFPPHENPEISVLIVVWNKAYFTLRCLRALQSVSSKIEVILVDNASTDETTDMLSRVDGIRVIVNDANEGFLTATNRAAHAARGQAFLLLNNDAFVRPGTIEAAFATLN
ncbi:methyltransferase domain-containing protein, partial [Bosea sp. TAB14]|uniref:methyltransferase domain-containing protein n=1 Tax=Bosea sp. TAB14 TaxID=3237481 RepID=UPI003F8EC543